MKLKITVHGVAYEVDVEVLDAKDELHRAASPLPPAPPAEGGVAAPPAPAPAAAAVPAAAPAAAGTSGGVASPIAGTVLEVKVAEGDRVEQGQTLLLIEAMKMETAIAAPGSGQVSSVLVAAGDAVRENQTLVELA